MESAVDDRANDGFHACDASLTSQSKTEREFQNADNIKKSHYRDLHEDYPAVKSTFKQSLIDLG